MTTFKAHVVENKLQARKEGKAKEGNPHLVALPHKNDIPQDPTKIESLERARNRKPFIEW